MGFQGSGFREGSGVSGYVGVSKNWDIFAGRYSTDYSILVRVPSFREITVP